MRMYDIIYKKRQGEALSDEEIRFFVEGFTKGDIPDYQAAALAMAICFQGMDARETATLTLAMAQSGDSVDLSRFGTLTVDKHSTGGVGDKTSLIVTPIVASLGAKVAKMSGRGLGHTGGTVDKLESIAGYRTALSTDEFLAQVERVGLSLIGQTGNLTPADKKLYALRDVTATVDSIPLITSSIMSKKLAAGSHAILLDVKVGSGAFMKTTEQAASLAHNMVDIGNRCGRRTAALITDMNAPLGLAVGNALEVKEAVEVLRGGGPDDLREVCTALAATMLSLVFGWDEQTAQKKVAAALQDGSAFAKMKEWVAAQGGDTAMLDNPDLLPTAPYKKAVCAAAGGYVGGMNAEQIGLCAMTLGAGRERQGDVIDPAAGLVIAKKTGDAVAVGDVLCTLYTSRADTLDAAERAYLKAIAVTQTPPKKVPLIHETVM